MNEGKGAKRGLGKEEDVIIRKEGEESKRIRKKGLKEGRGKSDPKERVGSKRKRNRN